VRGYYVEPINQGKSYENERSPTRAEREAVFTAMHCIDVPVPPEVIMEIPSPGKPAWGTAAI